MAALDDLDIEQVDMLLGDNMENIKTKISGRIRGNVKNSTMAKISDSGARGSGAAPKVSRVSAWQLVPAVLALALVIGGAVGGLFLLSNLENPPLETVPPLSSNPVPTDTAAPTDTSTPTHQNYYHDDLMAATHRLMADLIADEAGTLARYNSLYDLSAFEGFEFKEVLDTVTDINQIAEGLHLWQEGERFRTTIEFYAMDWYDPDTNGVIDGWYLNVYFSSAGDGGWVITRLDIPC
jgi:hypothetical protein